MATLTTVNGYLVYDNDSNITKIPISLLPFCTLVDRITHVTILLPSEGTPKHEGYVDIIVPVSGITTTANLITFIQGIANSSTPSGNYSTRIDAGATYTYIGEVAIGSYATTNTAIWKIKRITNASGDKVWANASQSFDQIWDNRATTILYS